MVEETGISKVEENKNLEKKLTKRNEQYIFDLKKSLAVANLSEEKQVEALQHVLPKLIEGQKQGQTARQLFGTVSEQAQAILETPHQTQENQNLWINWLDTSLMMFAFLSIVLSILPLLSKSSQAVSNGLITMIVISLSGSFIMLLMDKYVYQYDRSGADKTKKPNFLKTMLILAGGVLIWVLIYTLSMLLPASINIVLEPVVAIVLGMIAFGIHYVVKKKYGTRSFFSAR